MKLLTDQSWPKITAAVRRAPGQCRVAVAYFGKGASQLLPLKRGSVLVVDFSPAAVQSGRVCPSEIQILLKRDVEVHSVANLHAKVFVVGDAVFVGSTNVSQFSAHTLVEAVAHGTDVALVRQSRKFVDSLRGEHITPDYAARMAKIYRAPKFGAGGGTQQKTAGAKPNHAPTWVVQLEASIPSKAATAAEKEGRPIARRRLHSASRFEVDDFHWEAGGFPEGLRKGHQVVQVIDMTPKGTFVSSPERVLYVKHYRTETAGPGRIVFLERPIKRRRRARKQMEKLLGRDASLLTSKSEFKLLTDAKFIHRLHQLWPKLS